MYKKPAATSPIRINGKNTNVKKIFVIPQVALTAKISNLPNTAIINMRKNKKLAKGVNQVMTLSQSIFSRGVQEGVEKGLVEGEAKGLAKGEIKGIAKGKAQGITEGEARNFIFSVKTLMKNTKKSKEEVLAMLGKTNQDYINALQILSDNN